MGSSLALAGRAHPADAGLMRPSPGERERSQGPVRTQAPGFSEGASSGPRRCYASGGPIFGRPKMGDKTAGETPDPHILSNWSCIKFAAALPLKQQILRASDLGQVSRPASAVALLKGQINLFSATNCLFLWEARGFSIAKNSKASQHEGRQAKLDIVPHRLRGASGLAEIQW